MHGGDDVRRCLCPCGRELKDRYKGREQIFYSTECRKKWHDLNPGKSARINKKIVHKYY
ncbi:MAG: hypothetical protein KGI05_08245 [Thaumarchaeota archaeon]|nr:hypothetical protein [Nitrososphaerota archaeon]